MGIQGCSNGRQIFFQIRQGDIKGNTGCTGYWISCSNEKERNSKYLLWMFGKIFQKISGVDFQTEISEKPCHWKTPLYDSKYEMPRSRVRASPGENSFEFSVKALFLLSDMCKNGFSSSGICISLTNLDLERNKFVYSTSI